MSKKLHIYTDGASRGNPGPASFGVCVFDDQGNLLLEKNGTLGKTTNSIAEYSALICALEEAKKIGAEDLKIFTDSELVAKQFAGIYRVKDEKLKELMGKVRDLEKDYQVVTVTHIPRSSHPGNVRADQLANIALNREASS